MINAAGRTCGAVLLQLIRYVSRRAEVGYLSDMVRRILAFLSLV